ncbi:MAG: GIY-YIG nuclease family protein [Gammaproteobacteria bacterium]|nr:GIY-YIG nuclease family protein [Gammaproteobacteria bacterium]
MTKQKQQNDDWSIYILRCADDSLYTGVAKHVDKRLIEHNTDNLKAAKYTRARRPVVLVYQEVADSRSAACKRESAIKKLSRAEKLLLIGQGF